MRQNIIIWGLAALLTILVCLVFTLIWIIVGQEIMKRTAPAPIALATLVPTFTATFTPQPVEVIPTVTATPTNSPSPTDTSTPIPTATPVPPTATAAPVIPQAVANSIANLRSGPGTGYATLGSLSPNSIVTIVGRSADGTWWQIQTDDGVVAWVAASIVTAQSAENVPVVAAPPLPKPTATPTAVATPVPTKPLYQYEPTGWFSDKNPGLTRFLGSISDNNGTPANGVQVEAQCGDYHVVSNPSGPASGWPEGFYDITLARYPIVCKWLLTVVTTDETGKVATGKLSATVEIEVTETTSIVTANWRKNW